MDSKERLWNMEGELAASRIHMESMENTLKAIMKKLEIPNVESIDMEDLGPKKSAFPC
jgi:hypothetical protein